MSCSPCGLILIDMENALAPSSIIDGRYQIIELIGQGGMGSVYLALQLSLRRTIALKVLRQTSTWGESRSFTQRFLQEANLCANLSHRNIIHVFDYGFASTEGLYFIAMEYIDGETLGQRLARVEMLTEQELLPLAIEATLGLRYLHKKGVIHRDLKPENIMLSHDPEEPNFVKLLDFGLAKEVKKSSMITTAGIYVGSPSYMSPEQADGEPPDERSDIYSLGVVLYQCICGQVPFRESSPLKTMMAQITQQPPPLSAMRPGCRPSQLLERLIFRMLEKDPAGRPQSADELLASLRYLQSQNIQPETETAATKLPLAAQPPSLWVLSQDPSMRSDEVLGAISLLQEEMQVSFIATDETAEWARRIEAGVLLPPWVVAFGDMQVLIEDPLLKSLSSVGSLAKVLISTHHNTELLQHSVNFCGLDFHIPLPSTEEEIVAVIRGMLSRVLSVRRYSAAL